MFLSWLLPCSNLHVMDRPCICPHQIIGNAGVSVTLVILRLFISFHFARCPAGQTYRSASLLYSKGVCLFDYRQLQSLNEQRGAYCFPLPFEILLAGICLICYYGINFHSCFLCLFINSGNCCPSPFSPEVTVAAVIILSSLIAICVL